MGKKLFAALIAGLALLTTTTATAGVTAELKAQVRIARANKLSALVSDSARRGAVYTNDTAGQSATIRIEAHEVHVDYE